MAVDPFEHVMDTSEWHFFESFHARIHLPKIYLPLYGDFQITKFMILELVAAVLIVIIYVPLARRAASGELPKGFVWNTFESMLTFIRNHIAMPTIGPHASDPF